MKAREIWVEESDLGFLFSEDDGCESVEVSTKKMLQRDRLFREVLPNELTPEATIRAVCEFLKRNLGYSDSGDYFADLIKANADKILGVKK